MFGLSPIGHSLQMLYWLTFWLLQAFLTCKDYRNNYNTVTRYAFSIIALVAETILFP